MEDQSANRGSVKVAELSDRAMDVDSPNHPITEVEMASNEAAATSPSPSDSDGDANAERLANLLAGTKDQVELERNIHRQADALLVEQADERDRARLAHAEQQKHRHLNQIKDFDRQLAGPGGSLVKNKIRANKANAEALVKSLENDIQQINARIADRHQGDDLEDEADIAGNRRRPNESRRDYLIRTGKITPFSKIVAELQSENLAEVLLHAEEHPAPAEEISALEATTGATSHVKLAKPGFLDESSSQTSSSAEDSPQHPAKRRRIELSADKEQLSTTPVSSATTSDDDFGLHLTDLQLATLGETEGSPGAEIEEDDDDYSLVTPGKKKRKVKERAQAKKAKKGHVGESDDEEEVDLTGMDDGNESVYQSRIQSWSKKRSNARLRVQIRQQNNTIPSQVEEDVAVTSAQPAVDDTTAEWFRPHPKYPDTELEGGLRIPGDIFPALFDYQQTGVRWLWELYQQQVGGIVGDEMGLGKTVQIVSFVAALHHSQMLNKPVLIVAPATVMRQWVNEFHRWWPALRVSILHSSGTGLMNIRHEKRVEDNPKLQGWGADWFEEGKSKIKSPQRSKSHDRAAKAVVNRVATDGHVLVTTYNGLQTYADLLLSMDWGYAVLDEGHKIRNPNTALTMYCKMLRTHNRIILSGTPIQNNLSELWSLFDFVFPMRLGNLVTFRNQFEFPIKQGGYASASNLQIQTAANCAEALKEAISPYLLQRTKIDVAQDLPKKKEQIMFCKLTKLQRESYLQFLRDHPLDSMVPGTRPTLFGIDALRKICNHPDLADHKMLSKRVDYDYGKPSKSGKMQVVRELLKLWKNSGDKALLFTQHRITLDILEKMVRNMAGINYLRMDGNTAIRDRQALVDKFNASPDIHVFLMTTKVGGLGTNLTGANRVIIYDPDWNPSTDEQARERAWRLGQQRSVEIYRLMTVGTIEEKMYQRQVFKQFLASKILRDPKARQAFEMKQLHDLFTLGDDTADTETGRIFKDSKSEIDATNARVTVDAPEFEGIRGIHHQEALVAPNEEEAAAGKDDDKPDRVLSAIFNRADVHSVHDHGSIVKGSSGKEKVTADPEIIAREARRIATKAAKELRRAAEIAHNIPAGQVTWTGVLGTTGRPDEGAGPCSRVVSERPASRGRVNQISSSASSSRTSTPLGNRVPRAVDVMKMIISFIKRHGGMVHTQMLSDHFGHRYKTKEGNAQFKEMLLKVAVLEKGESSSRGRWFLKDEYKN